jgi:UDP-hydrolysing UDP-N-acetyl-D-glucosamine 2-epimerase
MGRRIAVITGSRAEFGLLSGVISLLRAAPDVDCQVVVTGAHLSAAHGDTVDEIVDAGVPIAFRVDLQLGDDSSIGTVAAMGRAMLGFADALGTLRPDIMVVLGDRYEILMAASAATVACIPVAHIHGGEITAGAVDDAIRHAITKLSALHFVAAEPYRRRVIQMGEMPSRVHLVGGLGVDLVRNTPRIDRATLEVETGFRFGRRNVVVTYHPVTLAVGRGTEELEAILDALDSLDEVHVAFTLPNADVGNAAIRERIESYSRERDTVWAFSSLGFRRYISFVAESNGVVGNSSSGLIEAPALGVGTVNVGSRQDGRLRAASVIDAPSRTGDIVTALQQMLSNDFQTAARRVANPYGTGGSAERVVAILRSVALDGLTAKDFHDLPGGALALTAHD